MLPIQRVWMGVTVAFDVAQVQKAPPKSELRWLSVKRMGQLVMR